MIPPGFHGRCRCSSSADMATLKINGDKIDPCGLPRSVGANRPPSITPAFSQALTSPRAGNEPSWPRR
jgi:hypothetical protein